MPSITVQLLRGRTIEQRRAFAEALTDVAVATLGARRSDVRIAFEHIDPEDVANGGVLAVDDSSRAAVLAGLGHEPTAAE